MDHVTRSRPVHPSDAATNGLSVSALIHASLAVMASFQYLGGRSWLLVAKVTTHDDRCQVAAGQTWTDAQQQEREKGSSQDVVDLLRDARGARQKRHTGHKKYNYQRRVCWSAFPSLSRCLFFLSEPAAEGRGPGAGGQVFEFGEQDKKTKTKKTTKNLQLLLSLLVHSNHNSTALKNRHVNDQVSTPAAAPAAPDGSCAIPL